MLDVTQNEVHLIFVLHCWTIAHFLFFSEFLTFCHSPQQRQDLSEGAKASSRFHEGTLSFFHPLKPPPLVWLCPKCLPHKFLDTNYGAGELAPRSKTALTSFIGVRVCGPHNQTVSLILPPAQSMCPHGRAVNLTMPRYFHLCSGGNISPSLIWLL